MDIIYKIKDLKCSYDQKNIVLTIPDLVLDRGKIYFFIGASGVGKSTLLETLGMMNYPVLKNQGIIEYHTKEEIVNLYEKWNSPDSQVSDFRLNNFSFIFQNTNLMPHFTAGENMCYTLLIEGKKLIEAISKVKDLMPFLSLDDSLFDRPIQHLSGGQRQRLAFVRAFVSTFEVLFGDEPTGNLDPITARNLMDILKQYIKTHNKTAIIVSHDIPLATVYGDKIYYLKKTDNLDSGLLSSNQFYEKKDGKWYHDREPLNGDIIQALQQFL
jgi:ABC-type lipoprotein export system ATPase subunit